MDLFTPTRTHVLSESEYTNNRHSADAEYYPEQEKPTHQPTGDRYAVKNVRICLRIKRLLLGNQRHSLFRRHIGKFGDRREFVTAAAKFVN